MDTILSNWGVNQANYHIEIVQFLFPCLVGLFDLWYSDCQSSFFFHVNFLKAFFRTFKVNYCIKIFHQFCYFFSFFLFWEETAYELNFNLSFRWKWDVRAWVYYKFCYGKLTSTVFLICGMVKPIFTCGFYSLDGRTA